MATTDVTPNQRRFLAAFRESGNVSAAAKLAAIHRCTHYQWFKTDACYAEAFQVAKQEAADLLEAEAHRRAVEGTLVPVGWYKGQPGGYVREYSDSLLVTLMKASNPYKFGDRLALRGTLATLDYSTLPDEAVARIARGEHPYAVLASLGIR